MDWLLKIEAFKRFMTIFSINVHSQTIKRRFFSSTYSGLILYLFQVIQTGQTDDKNKSGDGGKKDSFEQFHLDAHNKYRKVHNAPSMTLNSKMSKEAEEYAKKIAKLRRLQHSSPKERNGQGENLAYSCKSGDTKDDFATKYW